MVNEQRSDKFVDYSEEVRVWDGGAAMYGEQTFINRRERRVHTLLDTGVQREGVWKFPMVRPPCYLRAVINERGCSSIFERGCPSIFERGCSSIFERGCSSIFERGCSSQDKIASCGIQ